MPLKTINGHVYFYKSVRDDGKARNIYQCSGDAALLDYQIAFIERIKRNLVRAAQEEKFRVELARLDQLAEVASIYAAGVDRVVSGALESAGYHRQGRHQWRKRRDGMKTLDDTRFRAWQAAPYKTS